VASALDTYLNDHLAGAFAGRALSRRAAERQRGTDLAPPLERVAREIREDVRSLEQLMERLGIPRRTQRAMIGELAHAVGRLKFGGVLDRGSPVATLEELETLALGIEGKLALWGVLRHGASDDSSLGPELDGLISRARTQRELVEELRLKAAEAVLQESEWNAKTRQEQPVAGS
jgi:hypothetical protein